MEQGQCGGKPFQAGEVCGPSPVIGQCQHPPAELSGSTHVLSVAEQWRRSLQYYGPFTAPELPQIPLRTQTGQPTFRGFFCARLAHCSTRKRVEMFLKLLGSGYWRDYTVYINIEYCSGL